MKNMGQNVHDFEVLNGSNMFQQNVETWLYKMLQNGFKKCFIRIKTGLKRV